MDRRTFLKAGMAASLLGAAGCRTIAEIASPGRVMTVQGWLTAGRMGATLPHEHVLVDFAGADRVHPDRYDRQEVFDTVLPYLQRLREAGGSTLVECTPAYLGRDPLLLRSLAGASGLRIITNTGYYGAREDVHLPEHAFTETANALADRWVREFEEGIDGTGVRPGFIKIGVDEGPLSDVDHRLVRAAARTHRRTGLTVAVHTGPAPAAFEQLDVLENEGVDPSAWIWVHAQAEPDLGAHVRAAVRGGWVEFDGLGPETVDQHVALVTNMRAHGQLHRVLVSHDAGWYHVGEPGGGTFRPFDVLFAAFVPALRAAGLDDDDILQLVAINPAEAFTVRRRLR